MALFQATSKVQKDRGIMRETDARMAKYSRRGLVLNAVAYVSCLVFGDLPEKAPSVAIMLTVGLVALTILRGFFVVRFDALYANGPARWRNQFFVVTLIGSVWWGVIMMSFTVIQGMVNETPILWIYTVIFFFSTTPATSPFKRFSKIYQAVAVIPPALGAIWIGSFEAYIYSILMLIFILMLQHQVDILGDTYWEKLEANYALKQRAQLLEAEIRDVDASVDLNIEFLSNLGHEFRTTLNDVIASLALLSDSDLNPKQKELLKLADNAGERQLDLVNNVVDFSKINNGKIILEHSVFNLRQHLEGCLADIAIDSHHQGVELDYTIDPYLPLRVNADERRIGQVFKNILTNAVKFAEHGLILAEIEFDQDAEKSGRLKVIVTDKSKKGLSATSKHLTENGEDRRDNGIWIAICKGLADCMDGTVEVILTPNQDAQYLFQIPVTIASRQTAVVTANPKLNDVRVLIVTADLTVHPGHYEELTEWGMRITTTANYDQALQKLDSAREDGHPYQALLLIVGQDQSNALAFSQDLVQHKENQLLKQILVINHNDFQHADLINHIDAFNQVHFIYRPIIRNKLHNTLCSMLFNQPIKTNNANKSVKKLQGKGRSVLLAEDNQINQLVVERVLRRLGYKVLLANNGYEALILLNKNDIDLIFMDCQMPEMDGYEASQKIREQEKIQEKKRIPIVAMTGHKDETDQSKCFAAGMDDCMMKPATPEDIESYALRWSGQ